MPYSTAARNAMLDALGAVAGFVSLHTADPGTTGANEVSGGSYARKAASYATASGSSKPSSNAQAFPVPPATTVSHFGLWSAASGGVFYGGGPLVNDQGVPTPETFNGAGTYTMAAGQLTLALAAT